MAFRSIKADAMPADLLEAQLFGRKTGERGMLEQARGGTIFIDGLDSIPLPLQAKLAGFLNGKEDIRRPQDQDPAAEDARVILGVERPLKELISEKRVCEEIGECLSEPPLVLPPLAGRAEDIGFLVNKFLWKFSTELDREIDGLEDDVMDLLIRHSWPDNLRELENVIRDSVFLTQGRRVKRETVEAAIEGRITAEKILSRRQNGTIPAGDDGEKTSAQGPAGKARLGREDVFFKAMRMTSLGVALHVKGMMVFANPALGRILGVAEPKNLHGRHIFEFIAPDDRGRVRQRARDAMERMNEVPFAEMKLLRADCSTFDAEVTAFPLVYQKHDAVMVVVRDLTVSRRTEEALGNRQRELEEKSNRLEQTLQVVLSHRDQEKEEIEKTILDNVKKLVSPYIERMKAGHLTDNQLAYMETIEANLNHIISPFLRKMTSLCSTFTPTETQVAALIKEGRTTKQIAQMLNVASGTVHAHRNSIRAKLKINNEDINLRSYLLSLEE